MERISKQIHNEIMQAKRILLIPHQNPDGDAIGSVLALSHFLKNENIEHDIFCVTLIPEKFSNFPHFINISNDPTIWNKEHDLIIVLDSGDLKYAGIDVHLQNLTHEYKIINIDHHPTNAYYGHHNMVIPASSTTEIIYYFFKKNKINIDKKIALSILLGLVTDTENFTNPGTTMSSLTVASDLIRKGANFNLIKNLFLKNKTISALKLWGSVLSRLNKNEEFNVVYTFVTKDDLTQNDVSDTEVEGISNFLNNLNEGRASLVLKELDNNKVKGSFRTSKDDFDVSAIAKALGGGGHKKAAGFTVEGSIDSVLNRVWEVLRSVRK